MKKTTNYQQLAQAILKNIGGKENINNLIHCITRLRFHLKDECLLTMKLLSNYPV